MGLFSQRKATPAPATQQPSPKTKYTDMADKEWLIREGTGNPDAIALALQQDIRRELKDLNKKLDRLHEDFRLVFGVENKKPGE